jgi:hypothetical protein
MVLREQCVNKMEGKVTLVDSWKTYVVRVPYIYNLLIVQQGQERTHFCMS